MNNKFLYIYIFCVIFFADTYVIFSWLKPITILNYILIFLNLFSNKTILNKKIKNLQLIFSLFIIFTFAVDLYQNDILKAYSSLITLIPFPVIFGIFSKQRDNYKYVFFYAQWYIIYNCFFALLQFSGFYVTAGELLAKLPLIDVDRGFAIDFSNQGLRTSGAAYSSIGFACNLGVISIFFYYFKIESILSKKKRIFYLFIIVVFIILSQTRSVIFALIPVIYLTNLIVNKTNVTNALKVSFSILLTSLSIIVLLPTIQQSFPRLFLTIEEDVSIVHRIQANVYGSVGTFYLSPFIGMPFSESLTAMNYGYNKLGLFLGNYYVDKVTQHNQPGYFFRYYGFIGFLFFVLIYKKMFQIGFSKKLDLNKKILFAILLFHFIYTLSHNNKITSDYYIWIFMALNLDGLIKQKNI
tara:strand:- start:863 stop:2095 length:1233 start_codon:yes stop_codon:yes gene_type:complete